MSKVVTQSRAYDAVFDSTFTTPYSSNMVSDPRVRAQVSMPKAVSGTERFKYSRRPIMPRLNAVPPQILLAPTVAQNPMAVVEEAAEPDIKDAGIQTVYRESEAQTVPYAPEYFVPEGTDPEVLLLKTLTHDKGLPVGPKEVLMIENARRKQDLESNLPPFTDEASLMFRKRLMEFQELREFRVREAEMDRNREERLSELEEHLRERDEANDFLVSQRLESTRQSKMQEKERAVQKLRSKRIKILRRLATRRNKVSTTGAKKDVIDQYFDKTSAVYVPSKRDGTDLPVDLHQFDVLSRTAPLNVANNIISLETSIPMPLLTGTSNITAHGGSATGPLTRNRGGGRAAEERLTSSAIRSIRNTKRDVEEMHTILLKKKMAKRAQTKRETRGVEKPKEQPDPNKNSSVLLSRKPKGRPTTPDIVSDPHGNTKDDRIGIMAACVLLQRLLRGRAIQNTMHEGRLRRKELIAELREVDTLYTTKPPMDVEEEEAERQKNRAAKIRESTVEAIIGGQASNVIAALAQEQERRDYVQQLIGRSQMAMEQRNKLEAAEAGRRQRTNMAMPEKTAADDSKPSTAGSEYAAMGSATEAGPVDKPPTVQEAVVETEGAPVVTEVKGDGESA